MQTTDKSVIGRAIQMIEADLASAEDTVTRARLEAELEAARKDLESPASVKYLPLGSVSWGTMREEDLIPSFLDALETVNPDRAAELLGKWEPMADRIISDEYGTHLDDDDVENAGYLLESLYDALETHCPPYCYFSSHPGDGADYGVWVCEESLADAVDEDEVHLVLPGGEWLARPDGGGLDYAVYDAGDGDYRKLVDARTGAVIWSV